MKMKLANLFYGIQQGFAKLGDFLVVPNKDFPTDHTEDFVNLQAAPLYRKIPAQICFSAHRFFYMVYYHLSKDEYARMNKEDGFPF